MIKSVQGNTGIKIGFMVKVLSYEKLHRQKDEVKFIYESCHLLSGFLGGGHYQDNELVQCFILPHNYLIS